MVRVSVASPAECGELAVQILDVDQAADLFSAEGLTASLRRAASFLCPASPRQLIDAVFDAVRPLLSGTELPRQDVSDLLDLLVSAGDLLELRLSGGTRGRLLYLGPPSYIERRPGQYLLLGIRPFGASLISPGLSGAIQYEGHTRTIELSPDRAAAQLSELGLHMIRKTQWVRRPPEMPPGELVRQMRERLSAAGPAGVVEGLTVIAPEEKVTYYHGRWRSLKPADSGLFVARRPQAYGADLWCVVLVAGGAPARLLDLPADDPAVPGHDEAWRVQAALDAAADSPQVFRVGGVLSTGASAGRTVDFFSPLPRWAERYLQLTGMAVPRTAGALFSYRVPEAAMPGLADFLASMLWMGQITTEGRNDG
jgi:hypothetical protein